MELRDAVEHRDALFALLLVRELGLEHGAELVPLTCRLVERLEDLTDLELVHPGREELLERLERLDVLRRRREDLAVALDGRRQVLKPGLVDLAEAVLEVEDVVGRVPDLGLSGEHGDELRPALHQHEQPVEGADRLPVLGIDLEHEAVPRDRVVDVLELGFEDLGEAKPELDEPLRLLLAEADELPVVQGGHLGPTPHGGRDALERAERLFVGHVQRDGAGIHVERRVVIPEHLLLEASDAVQQVDLREGVFGVRDLDLEDANEALPLPGRVVDRLEDERRRERLARPVLDALQRRDRRLVVRHLLEQIAIELDRPGEVVEPLLVQLGDAILEAYRLRRIGRQLRLLLQDAEQLEPVLRHLIEDVEPRERLQVCRVDLEHALVRLDRLGHVVELTLVDRADLVIDVLLLIEVLDQVRLRHVDGEQIAPPRVRQVQLDERVDRAQLVLIELEDLAVHSDRCLVPVQHVFLDRSGLEQGALLLGQPVEDVGLLLQHLRELCVPLGRAEDPFEGLRGREVRRIDLEHLAVVQDRRLGRAEIVLVDARCHHEEIDGDGGVAYRGGLVIDVGATDQLRGRPLLEDLREIGVAIGGAGEAIEALLRVLGGGVLGEGATERVERGVGVSAGVLVECGDLMEKLDAPARIVAAPDLDLVDADELLPVARLPIERL